MTPGHTITITPADLHVTVTVDGVRIAESDRPVLLDETGLPTRYYLPKEDLVTELRPTTFSTQCPFKGDASYWTLALGDKVHDGIAWSYETPIPGAEDIAGLVAFYPERADIEVTPAAA
jgi:uncharacterized protein (DUF427 family)